MLCGKTSSSIFGRLVILLLASTSSLFAQIEKGVIPSSTSSDLVSKTSSTTLPSDLPTWTGGVPSNSGSTTVVNSSSSNPLISTTSSFNPANVSQTDSSIQTPIELILGPLGTCFTDEVGRKRCQTAKLFQVYDYSPIRNRSLLLEAGAISQPNSTTTSESSDPTLGLPQNLGRTRSITLLSLVLVHTSTLFSTALPKVLIRIDRKSSGEESMSKWEEPGERRRWLFRLQSFSNLLILTSALVQIILGLSLRVKVGDGVRDFNQGQVASAVEGQTVWNAKVGNRAFGLVWFSTILLVLTWWLRRRELRRGRDLDRARIDVQSLLLRKGLTTRECPGRGDPQGSGSMIQISTQEDPSLPPYNETKSGRSPNLVGGGDPKIDPTTSSPFGIGGEIVEGLSWRLVGDQSGRVYN
ncbi:hypothetical protein IE53DRAFT_388448 [Violaceomyces palustris]|uniref:Uncharacterized protein n=1 Tax=Violaceomyces palustris TaxID=1673888 RepID=A0ACD0NU47_9BASI|nr:hypothetical protein IE53DRAFT_388448 [Violaceomyces palustris]